MVIRLLTVTWSMSRTLQIVRFMLIDCLLWKLLGYLEILFDGSNVIIYKLQLDLICVLLLELVCFEGRTHWIEDDELTNTYM